MRTARAVWNEAKHPRDSHGRFGHGGGGKAPSAREVIAKSRTFKRREAGPSSLTRSTASPKSVQRDPHRHGVPHTAEPAIDHAKWPDAGYDDIAQHLAGERQDALNAYTSDDICLPLNKRLRGGGDLGEITGPSFTDDDYEQYGSSRPYDLKELRDNLDWAISSGYLKRDVSLWRGAALTPSQVDSLTPGTELTDAAFMSTSLDPSKAEEFAAIRASNAPGTAPYVFRLLAPKGTKAVAADTDFSEVDEVVLPRDLATRVVEVNGNVIVLQVV